MADHKEMFWTRVKNLRAGLLSIPGSVRPMPMSPQLDHDPAEIWFLSARGQPLVEACETGSKTAEFSIADADAAIYALVEGEIDLVEDGAKVDEIWSRTAAIWYEDGRDDPDIRLLRLRPRSAEVWFTPTNVGKFLYEVVKGSVADEGPDMGAHTTLTFAAV